MEYILYEKQLDTESHLSAQFATSFVGTVEYIAPEVFKGKYSTKADIYSFGMNLLEMCTQESPYKEYASSSIIYNCIKSAVLPKAIETIKDSEIVELISLCLSDQRIRPSAKELLAHKALEINEDPSNYLPVPIISKASFKSAIKNNEKIHISLIIKLYNHSPKNIEFDYNINCDSPEKVAKEMVENLKYDHILVIRIAEEIEKKIEIATFNTEKDLKIKICRCRDDTNEINTACQVIESIPLIRNFNSFDEIIEANFSKSDHIANIQKLLSQVYSVKLLSDGFIGQKTIDFIKRFQHQEGLNPDGIITEEFFKLLAQRARNAKY